MFDQLTNKLDQIFRNLTNRGKLTPANIHETLREIRRVLLEADVNYKVAKDFISQVEAEALGEEVISSITPGQKVIKIVHSKLVELLGGSAVSFDIPRREPSKIMLVGLQGSGKTTLAGKLALYLKGKNWSPVLVAADIYRPAAGEQLNILGKSISIPTVVFEPGEKPLETCLRVAREAPRRGWDILIMDTAGRLQIDTVMMAELKQLKNKLTPEKIILVVDSMTGQEAVAVASEFEKELGVDGFALTKLDGDARGGAALSLRAITMKPILFAGVGEKLSQLEPFYPDRMASRILGMGDIVSLVEKAEQLYDEEKARELEKKIRKDELSLQDFYNQLQQLKKMGPLQNLMEMIPGFRKMNINEGSFDEREFSKIEAIISSMTPAERKNPDILDGSRRKRIASGSGTQIQDVNKLLKQFKMTKKMMSKMSKLGPKMMGF
ncbi:signal recognition particle protein [bacterium]|nr:signal recognition particle protein [bacterium]